MRKRWEVLAAQAQISHADRIETAMRQGNRMNVEAAKTAGAERRTRTGQFGQEIGAPSCIAPDDKVAESGDHDVTGSAA